MPKKPKHGQLSKTLRRVPDNVLWDPSSGEVSYNKTLAWYLREILQGQDIRIKDLESGKLVNLTSFTRSVAKEAKTRGGPDMATGDKLHQATDRLNTVILDLELALQRLELGVSGFVNMSMIKGKAHRLHFAPRGLDGAYSLQVQTGDVWTPICSAARDTRLEACDLFEALYWNLLDRFEANDAELNAAAEKVRAFSAELRGGKS